MHIEKICIIICHVIEKHIKHIDLVGKGEQQMKKTDNRRMQENRMMEMCCCCCCSSNQNKEK